MFSSRIYFSRLFFVVVLSSCLYPPFGFFFRSLVNDSQFVYTVEAKEPKVVARNSNFGKISERVEKTTKMTRKTSGGPIWGIMTQPVTDKDLLLLAQKKTKGNDIGAAKIRYR